MANLWERFKSDKRSSEDQLLEDIEHDCWQISNDERELYIIKASSSIRAILETHPAYYASPFTTVNRLYGIPIQYEDLPHDGYELQKIGVNDIEFLIGEARRMHESDTAKMRKIHQLRIRDIEIEHQRELTNLDHQLAERLEELDALKVKLGKDQS